MLRKYMELLDRVDRMVASGMNSLDPMIRSMLRQADKIYRKLTDEERSVADYGEYITY